MKRVLTLLLASVMALALAACGGESAEKLSAEQESAMKKVGEYLDIMAFSRVELIDNLKDDGFSEEDATYAVDNCGANWKEQASKRIEGYLETRNWSYDGLIDQLEDYAHFSSDEATYAADHCGIDWKEQAAKRAKEIRKGHNYSHQELADYLKDEGFTAEQAEYGASEVK